MSELSEAPPTAAFQRRPQTLRNKLDVMVKEAAVLWWLVVLLCAAAGLVAGSDVTQPEQLWTHQGDDVTINCKHTKGSSYSQMYWYRQLRGEHMKLIVFTTVGADHDFGNSDKRKFSATKPNAESGTFTVKNLEAADEGLIFCAVSEHSDTNVGGG
ncbi:hypothetical protein D4764_16G0010470 [Takifugu flavidus]|uniref:Ig-like domain-containing protein n=1 Tax=Takifugu flavidus TaxID=433684 RepID=A0A5C6P302_9TELE|nr:hypothetical protein D4764_16G0010470 [Takifugu flavidus]